MDWSKLPPLNSLRAFAAVADAGSYAGAAENLNVTHYSDGTPIPLVQDSAAWASQLESDKAFCWYDNNSSYGDPYGALYNWAAAMNGAGYSLTNPSGVQGVCPDGWHMPSDTEWKQLELYLGMTQEEVDIENNWRGTNEGSKLKDNNTYWPLSDDATNESGFTALPAGMWQYEAPWNGYLFSNLYSGVAFWTTTGGGYGGIVIRYLSHYETRVLRFWAQKKNSGLSVRCVKD